MAAACARATACGGGIDLPALTIVEAARQISKRQLSPVELTEAVLARIDALNPRVGAFITVTAEQAMEAARAAERDIQQGRYRGPLHGIPVAVKDTYYTKGIRTTAASPVLEDFVPEFDSTIVERMKAAGAILIGKLNLPEFSFGGYTPGCHNPWDLTRNPGRVERRFRRGAGGLAAARCAGRRHVRVDSQSGEQLRRGRPQAHVRRGQPPRRHSHQLDARSSGADGEDGGGHRHPPGVIAGYDRNDRFSARVPVPDYPRLLRRSMRGLRLGVIAPAEIDGFHPDTKKRSSKRSRCWRGSVREIREVSFPARMKVAGRAHGIIRISEAAAYHRQFLPLTKRTGTFPTLAVPGRAYQRCEPPWKPVRC